MHSYLAFSLPSDFTCMLGNHHKDGLDAESRALSLGAVRCLYIFPFTLNMKICPCFQLTLERTLKITLFFPKNDQTPGNNILYHSPSRVPDYYFS